MLAAQSDPTAAEAARADGKERWAQSQEAWLELSLL